VKSVLVGKLDNKKLYYIIDADETRSDGVLVDDLGKKELINFWQFVRNEPRVKRMMNSDFHKFLWQDSQNQREKALWNNVFIAKAFLPDDELLQTVPIKDDILGRKSVLHGLMNRALDFDITRRSNTVEEKAVRGRLGSAIGRAFKPKRSTGKKFVRRSMEEIEGVLDPRKRRDSDGDGMIFDGTSREMPDPARAASTAPTGFANTFTSATMDSQLPDVDAPLISVDSRKKRVVSQMRGISAGTGVPATLKDISDFMREKFASAFGFKKIKEKLNDHEAEAFAHWNNGIVPKTAAEAHEILAKIHPTYIMDRPARHDELKKHVSFDFLLDKDATEELKSWEISLLASHLLFMKEAENLPNSPIGHNFYYMDLDRAKKVSEKVAKDLMSYFKGESSLKPLPMGYLDLKINFNNRTYRASDPQDLATLRQIFTSMSILTQLQGQSDDFYNQIGGLIESQTKSHLGYQDGVSGYWGFNPGAKITVSGSVEKLYAPRHIVAYQSKDRDLSGIGLPPEESRNQNISILDLLRKQQQSGDRIAITAWLADEDEITNKKLAAKKEQLSQELKNLEKKFKNKEQEFKISSNSGVLSPEQNINMQKDIIELRQKIEKIVSEIEEIEKNIDVDTPERRKEKAKALSEILTLNTAHPEHGHGHENLAMYNDVEKSVLARRDERILELKAKGSGITGDERQELNILSSATDHRELWNWYLFDQMENGPEEVFEETFNAALQEISAYGFAERYETLFTIDPLEQGVIDGFQGAVRTRLLYAKRDLAGSLTLTRQNILLLQRRSDSQSIQMLNDMKDTEKQLVEDIKNIDIVLGDFDKATDTLKSQPLFDPKTRSTIKVSEEQKNKFNKVLEGYAQILEDMPDRAIDIRPGTERGKKLAAIIRRAKVENDELTVGDVVEIISAGRVLVTTNVGSGARFITIGQNRDLAPTTPEGFSYYGSAIDGLTQNMGQLAVIKDLMDNGLSELLGEDSEENAMLKRAVQSMGMTARGGQLQTSAFIPNDLGFIQDMETGASRASEDMEDFDPHAIVSYLNSLFDFNNAFPGGRNPSTSPHDGSVLMVGNGQYLELDNFVAALYGDADLLEKARTKSWGELWESLTPEQKIVVRKAIAKDSRRYMGMRFDSYPTEFRGQVLYERISQQFSLDNLSPEEKSLMKAIVRKMAVAGGESYVEKGYRTPVPVPISGIDVLSFLGNYGQRELASELNSALKSGMNILGGQSLTPEEKSALTKYATWLLHGSRTDLEQSVKSENHIFIDNKRTVVGTRWTR